MKRSIIPLLTVVTVISIVFAGCVPEEAPTEAPTEALPEVAGIPPEPPGFPQPNPYWGLGFKPDGTPYKFGNIICDLSDYMWVVNYGTAGKTLRMSGAEVWDYDCEWDLDRQIQTIEDLIVKGADAIIMFPIDFAGTGPAVDKAGKAGVPVFNIDCASDSEYQTFITHYDQYEFGAARATILMDEAKRLDVPLHVYEFNAPMSLDVVQQLMIGYQRVEDANPDIFSHVIEAPDLGANWSNEYAMSMVVDIFTAHPELNAISSVNVFDGIEGALKSVDRWYPIGHPKHVIYASQNDAPAACDGLRDEYIDGVISNDCWAMADCSAKALLTYVCLGKPVPKDVVLPTEIITKENVNINPWKGPMRWGDMLEENSDISTWPVLDLSPYFETPTMEMKLER